MITIAQLTQNSLYDALGITADDFIQANGYADTPIYGGNTTIIVSTTGAVTGGTVTSTYPAQDAVSTATATAGSSVNINVIPSIAPSGAAVPIANSAPRNVGWNAWARSRYPLNGDYSFDCSIITGVAGVFLGIAPRGYEGYSIGAYQHGLLIDSTAVTAKELGQSEGALLTGVDTSAKLRIFRDDDKTVSYVIQRSEGTTVVRSEIPRPESRFVPLYVYCYLYAAGDAVSSEEFTAAKVHYLSV